MNKYGNIKNMENTANTMSGGNIQVDVFSKHIKPIESVDFTFTAHIQNNPSVKKRTDGAYDYTKETWKHRGMKNRRS